MFENYYLKDKNFTVSSLRFANSSHLFENSDNYRKENVWEKMLTGLKFSFIYDSTKNKTF